ncbi:MAG: glutamate-1-semialdehyde 2,1-aminomutase [Verrucomicrobiota bacterium]|nr:glutamate-1-semialdehyde 2,1-aminomutase [Verrucomicrobiota bacterium]
MSDVGSLQAQPTTVSLFSRAQAVIPGGVNSPVRAFRSVGGEPLCIASGNGARMTTVEGRVLVDFCGSWGPLILGHAHPAVVDAIRAAASAGTSFGVNTPAEVELAEMLCRLVPSIEQVRLVSSGTEAVMTAIRLARGYTGRRRLLKFDGCYHGHSDSMLVSAGSGLLTGGIGSSAGVPSETAADVFVAQYNDLDAVGQIAQKRGNDLAAIIVEPVAANMGLVAPAPGFLAGLRAAADRCGALLIFDEVITGFRFGPTTYGQTIGISPDLTTLGKIVGGGMPIGAVGGRKAIMGKLAPIGPVYQAGTLSGNPAAVAAGLATLKVLERENPYARLDALTERLAGGVNAAARATGINVVCARMASLFTVYFRKEPAPRNLEEAKLAATKAFAAFFRKMLVCGHYLPPSQFEVGFVSAAHTEREIDGFVAAARESFTTIEG